MSEFRSKTSCRMVASRSRRTQVHGWSGAGLFGSINGFVSAHGAPDVVSHDQRASDEDQTTDGANDVIGLHRLDGFDERVLQEAQAIVGTPHQALGNAGHPHRGYVKENTDRCGPEVPFD